MGTIDALAGLARARTHTTNIPFTCLGFVYAAYGSIQSIGPGSGHYGIAYNAWVYSTAQHPGDYNPPAGAPVVFGPSPSRSDSNAGAGDIAISMGGGLLFCTDATYGRTGVMTIAARAKQTGRPYLGWMSDFLGHTLVNLGVVTAPAGGGGTQGNGFNQDTQNRQNWLISIGISVGASGADGIEGDNTKAGYAVYQKDLRANWGYTGLIDGVWGNGTQAAHQRKYDAMHPAPAPAPAGGVTTATFGRVDVVQQALKNKYPLYAGHLDVDNLDGPDTQAAVSEFQRRAGLKVDGIAGPQTRAALGV